jgi:DNA-directed RNA polymerase specialized sigma24 family protein
MRKYGCESFAFDDLYQEAFSIMAEKKRTCRTEISYPYSYVIHTCKYLWFKEKRSRGIYELMDCMDDFAAVESNINYEKALLLNRNMHFLSATCKEVLALYVNGYSEEKISEMLNLGSSKAAKNKKYYCKERLKDLILIDPLFEELYG